MIFVVDHSLSLTSCVPLRSKDFKMFVVDLRRVVLCIQKTLMMFVVDYSLSYVVCSFAFKRL